MVHEVRCVVFRIIDDPDTDAATGAPRLAVLLWQRGIEPQAGTWSLPGGALGADEDLTTSARRQLAEKVDLREVAHLEQIATFSDPGRMPGPRAIASTYLGLVPVDSATELPADTRWLPVDALPTMSFDHRSMVDLARSRLAAKMSYTNIAFALAPHQFPMSALSEIFRATLGYPVDATNLLRILSRRGVVETTGTVGRTGRSGGRPPALYRFTDNRLRVTDEFATLRPPP